MHFFQLLTDGIVELNRTDDTGGDDHSTGLATDLMCTDDFVQKVIDNNQGFLLNGLGLAFHECTNLFGCLILVEFGIRLNGFKDFIIALVWCIVTQDIHNKAFLNGLFHSILMERLVPNLAIRALHGCSKHLQCLVLWRGRESIVIHVGSHLAPFDNLQDALFDVFFIILSIARDNNIHICRHGTVLGAMGLIYDDGKVEVPKRAADGIQNELELVDSSNNNLLATLQGFTQCSGIFRPCHNVGKALECGDVVANLLVQVNTVRNHDDGVHDVLVILY